MPLDGLLWRRLSQTADDQHGQASQDGCREQCMESMQRSAQSRNPCKGQYRRYSYQRRGDRTCCGSPLPVHSKKDGDYEDCHAGEGKQVDLKDASRLEHTKEDHDHTDDHGNNLGHLHNRLVRCFLIDDLLVDIPGHRSCGGYQDPVDGGHTCRHDTGDKDRRQEGIQTLLQDHRHDLVRVLNVLYKRDPVDAGPLDQGGRYKHACGSKEDGLEHGLVVFHGEKLGEQMRLSDGEEGPQQDIGNIEAPWHITVRPREGQIRLVHALKGAVDILKAAAHHNGYDEGVTDEFIKPINNSTVDGTIKEGDVVIFFNYRNDRAKELTVVLTQQDMPEQGMHTIPGLQFYCMTPYDASFKGVHILFDKENVQNTLGEYLAANGKTQLHIAETEKYAHVTFFFNGGRETPYDAEERILVPSPKVATYDLKPEMSAYEVKDKLVEAIKTQKFDFIVVNYANGDMVGHTGIYDAIEKAVKAIDECVKDTVEAAKANDYEVIIIADHGNADHALNEDGTPNTAHSLNPVPFVYVTENKNAKVENGVLADVAPSILHILGMPQPADMTGRDLIK